MGNSSLFIVPYGPEIFIRLMSENFIIERSKLIKAKFSFFLAKVELFLGQVN